MLKTFLKRQIDALERRWSYDAGYLRRVIQARPLSGLKFGLGTQAANRADAPAEALAAAGLAATLSEDCGPCTQISVDMAAAGGVDPAILRAILAGNEAAMGETAALVWRFCRASLARDLDAADPLREEIVGRWGDKGLVAIGLTLTAGRMYPTLKYALGHGRTCSRVTVAGEPAPLHLAA